MTAEWIDGTALARELRAKTATRAAEFSARFGRKPGLAALLVGDNPASEVYVRNKAKHALEAGLQSTVHRLGAHVRQQDAIDLIESLNRDEDVDGILVQLPLPPTMSSAAALLAVDPSKDVDGFHPINVGLLAIGQPALAPCTPLGCIALAKSVLGDLAGVEAVVVGRSNIVGKPAAQLLTAENATVTLAHSGTQDIAAVCRRAELAIVAVGHPEMVRGSWIRAGAVVIDVGINRAPNGTDGRARLIGDVCAEEARKHARAITPVPGGVGPMTIAYLLENTVTAAFRRQEQARAGFKGGAQMRRAGMRLA